MLVVKRESIHEAAGATTQTAGALLEALANEDTRAVELAAVRVQVLARMSGLDTWTQERLELLDTIASAFAQGTAGMGALRLLAHVAHDPVHPARLM